MKHPIFISYKRVDKNPVFRLKEQIEAETGLTCWIDLDGIESDALFEDVIIDAIDNCELFLYCYSKEHAKIDDYETDWTIKEIDYAQIEKKRIVFINLDNTPLTKKFKFRYNQKQQVDATDESRIKKLISDIKVWFDIKELAAEKPTADEADRAGDVAEKPAAAKRDKAEKPMAAKRRPASESGEKKEITKSEGAGELPKSLALDIQGKKLYMVLSENGEFYLGNLNADGGDLSWWDNKWVQTVGVGGVCASAVVMSFIAWPVALVLGIQALSSMFNGGGSGSAKVDQAVCDRLSKATGLIFSVPFKSELKGVKEEMRKGCVVLRVCNNPKLRQMPSQ